MKIIPVVVACVIAAGSTVVAQDILQPEKPRTLTPLKVQIVLTRLKADKKISSLPYQLGVTANDGSKTSLRMGVDVPVMVTTVKTGPDSAPQPTSWNYRSVGTNIDCRADSAASDSFRLQITVSDSSIHLEPRDGAQKGVIAADVPAFRSFNSTFTVLMRDGQTTQYTSAVDPINGEVTKIDVTMTVMK
jgi:hypothetical protein